MAFTRERKLAFFAFLAPAAVTGIGFALGGTLGATILGGIGINLSTEIILHGATKIKEKWFGSANGILNHDIQHALVRGFIKSLTSLEERYFSLEEANGLPKKIRNAIKELFQELKVEALTIFIPSIEKAVNETEVQSLLYGDPQEAQKILWERVEGTKLIYSYYGEHFKNFLRENCTDEIVFWFGEELKTDDKENNKAWRAFQRMLLEGIQADVKSIKAGQDEIKHDLKVLAKIRKQLLDLKDTLDHRQANEPFQDAFKRAIDEIQKVLHDVKEKVDVVDVTTRRSEAKIDLTLAILGRMEQQLSNLVQTEKPNKPPPEDMLRHPVPLETVMLDVFVPLGVIGVVTAYGGYSCILKSDQPSVTVLIHKDYVDLSFDPDPELLSELKQIYMLKQASAIALPYQAIMESLSKRFYRTDFSNINLQFTSNLIDLPSPSIDLCYGTGDDYFEIEIYPKLTETAVDRTMSGRVVIEDPDFIGDFAGLIVSAGMRGLVANVG